MALSQSALSSEWLRPEAEARFSTISQRTAPPAEFLDALSLLQHTFLLTCVGVVTIFAEWQRPGRDREAFCIQSLDCILYRAIRISVWQISTPPLQEEQKGTVTSVSIPWLSVVPLLTNLAIKVHGVTYLPLKQGGNALCLSVAEGGGMKTFWFSAHIHQQCGKHQCGQEVVLELGQAMNKADCLEGKSWANLLGISWWYNILELPGIVKWKSLNWIT